MVIRLPVRSQLPTRSQWRDSNDVRVIEGAVLVAAKLHSGRETDLRDVQQSQKQSTSIQSHLIYGGEMRLRCENNSHVG